MEKTNWTENEKNLDNRTFSLTGDFIWSMVVAKENKNESLSEMLSVREAGWDHHWTIFKYEQADVLKQMC